MWLIQLALKILGIEGRQERECSNAALSVPLPSLVASFGGNQSRRCIAPSSPPKCSKHPEDTVAAQSASQRQRKEGRYQICYREAEIKRTLHAM